MVTIIFVYRFAKVSFSFPCSMTGMQRMSRYLFVFPCMSCRHDYCHVTWYAWFALIATVDWQWVIVVTSCNVNSAVHVSAVSVYRVMFSLQNIVE